MTMPVVGKKVLQKVHKVLHKVHKKVTRFTKKVLKCCKKGTVQCSRHHTVGFATLHKTRRARSSLVATSKLDVIEQEARPHVRKGSKTELKERVEEEKSSINASFEAVLIVAIVEEIKIDINIKQH